MPNLDLEAIWGDATNVLLEQIQETGSDAERISKLNNFLEKRLLAQQDLVDYVDLSACVLFSALSLISCEEDEMHKAIYSYL